jgi:hypothetical protein
MSEAATPISHYLEPTFKRAAVVYWALLWRGILLGGGAGFLIGFIEGILGAIVGIPTDTIRLLALISGVICGVPAGIYAVQLVLRKRGGEFTIRLLSTKAEPSI